MDLGYDGDGSSMPPAEFEVISACGSSIFTLFSPYSHLPSRGHLNTWWEGACTRGGSPLRRWTGILALTSQHVVR